MLDVNFLKASTEAFSVSLGISGMTFLSTARLDAITYGLHWIKLLFMFIPRGTQIWVRKDSVARYTHIRPPLSLDTYLILLPPIKSANFRKYSSMEKPSTASKITPHFLCGAYSVIEVVFMIAIVFSSLVNSVFIEVDEDMNVCNMLPDDFAVFIVASPPTSSLLFVFPVVEFHVPLDASMAVAA
jgi:hypothetical protein